MNQVTISEGTLESMIETLESAISVCNKVDYNLSKKERMLYKNTEKTAPYALGYTRSTLQMMIEQLKTLKSKN
jgi:hypothetical protein